MSSYGLVELDPTECMCLLRSQRVGRVALGGEHPAVLPVVFGLLDDDVVFRTAPGEKLMAAVMHRIVAFEVDEYDEASESGWSVNAVGVASEIVRAPDIERVEALNLPCWAGDARDCYVRIAVSHLSGRRIAPSD